MKSVLPLKYIGFLALLMLLAPALPLNAAHLKGGYVEYIYLGPTPGNPNSSRYKVTVYQYLDCASSSGQVDADIFLGIYREGATAIYAQYTVPMAGTKNLSKRSFTCINNPPTVCYRVDQYVREIDLENSASPYTLTVQRCCRIASIVNVSGSSTTGVTYSIVIKTNATDGSVLSNASPVFAQKDTALVCANNGFNFPFEAADPDNDSLVYSFIYGQNTPTQQAKPNPPLPPPFGSVNYSGGYSAGKPMGDRVQINPTTGIISGIAPGIAGDYVVAVRIEEYRSGLKIGEARKEIHISVGNCDIPKAELPATMLNCQTFDVAFQNQSASSGIFSYSWDFGVAGSNDDTSNQPTPRYVFPDTGVYRVKLVTNKNGMCPDSSTSVVRVFPGFNPDFKAEGVCLQLPYQFTDLTTATYGTVSNWSWDFGDPSSSADISAIKNPTYRYSTAGSYPITFTVSTSKGCTDTITKTLVVQEKPTIQLAFRDTLICSIDSLQLQAIGSGNFNWTPASNIINANTNTPTVFPKDTTTYHVTLNDRGCTATDSVKVNVLDFITIDAGRDTTICRTDAFVLQPVTHALSFNWQPTALFDNATLRNPSVLPTDSLTTIVVTANLGRCQARDSLLVRTVPYPVANAGNDTTICYNGAATLQGSGIGSTALWRPTTALSNSSGYVTIATPLQTTSYTLTVTDNRGCPKPVSDDVLVTVRPRINVFAGNDTSVVYNQLLQFNSVANAPVINWTPSTALSNPNITNPTAIYRQGTLPPGVDTIRYYLTASTPEGCAATDDILVKIFTTAPSIFVPSGFTPNNDGLNDMLRPTLAGMRELSYFRIFNRYGQLVFETRQIGKGWDGRINGLPQSSGAYVYQCQAVDFEGKTVVAKGSFVLIR